MRRTFVSHFVPKLICNQYLRKIVMLTDSNFVNESRMSVESYLHGLCTGHLWLALTTSHTRFGAYTTLVNLQMFFCTLALHLLGNLISFCITRSTDNVFQITREEIFGCLISTTCVVFISWLFESLFRNIRPSSKIKREFEFVNLQYLKRKNIELEQSYEVYDAMLEVNMDLDGNLDNIFKKDYEISAFEVKARGLLSRDVKRSNMEVLHLAAEINKEENVSANIQCFSVRSLENKVSAIGNLVHNYSESSSITDEHSVCKNISPVSKSKSETKSLNDFENCVGSASDVEFAGSEFTFHSVSSTSVTQYEQPSLEKCINSDSETFAETSDFACNCCIPICCQKSQKTLPFSYSCETLPNFMHGKIEFFDALDLANHYAKIFLSSLFFLMDKADTHMITTCIQHLQESLAKSSVYLMHISDCLNNTSTRLFSCIDLEVSDMTCRTPSAFLPSHQANEDENRLLQSSLTNADQSFHSTGTAVSLESVDMWTVESELRNFGRRNENRLKKSCPQQHEEGDGTLNNLHRHDNQDLAHCSFCSEVSPVVMQMTFAVVSKAITYLPDIVQVKLNASELEISELDQRVLKWFSDMIMSFLMHADSLRDKLDDVPETDVEMLLGQCICSIVLSRALKQTYAEFKYQEYLQKVNFEANALYTWVVNQAVAELQEEIHINATIKEICESAVTDASDEVWADFQDPVYMFSESVLKQSFVDLVRQKLRKNDAYRLLHYASSEWIRELHELPLSAEMLFTQSLIFRFESDVHKMCQYFKTRSEYSEVEQKLCQMCLDEAAGISKLTIQEVCDEYKANCRETVPIKKAKFLRDCISLYLYQFLDFYVEKISMLSNDLLHDAFLHLLSRSLVEKSIRRGKDIWKQECLRKIRPGSSEDATIGSEFEDIKTEFQHLKGYLGYVSQDIQKENKKVLNSHLHKVSRRHKEHVTINLQNIVDSFYATDNLPREFTEEELFTVEWFVTGYDKKPFSFWLKPVLILLVVAMTLAAITYVVLKGAELTTVQSQEWVVLILTGCFTFALIFEPLKVGIMMMLSGEYRPYKDYF